jgi:integrase
MLREMDNESIELPSAILAARLLILTGCRLGELMTLQWDYVDFDERALHLPDSKTGKKFVHLGTPAVEYLQDAKRIDGNPWVPWVITGTLLGKPLNDLQPFWQRVLARAGVKDVRIHDLRHTFASTAVASGQSLPMIGKLLGHTQVQTTARYAHLAADSVRDAADSVATSLREALG